MVRGRWASIARSIWTRREDLPERDTPAWMSKGYILAALLIPTGLFVILVQRHIAGLALTAAGIWFWWVDRETG